MVLGHGKSENLEWCEKAALEGGQGERCTWAVSGVQLLTGNKRKVENTGQEGSCQTCSWVGWSAVLSAH